ncbi:MAG: RpiB/LacA/LacB family sugar-phosphate isomerase, partial [Pseudomonadota bacterium]
MKLAIAGDSAGEGLAKTLAEHLSPDHEVSHISRTADGPDAFYANLSDRVASAVLDGTYDRAILICGTGDMANLMVGAQVFGKGLGQSFSGAVT